MYRYGGHPGRVAQNGKASTAGTSLAKNHLRGASDRGGSCGVTPAEEDPAVDPGRVADRPRIAALPAGRGRRPQMDGQDVRDVVPPKPDGRGEQPQEPDWEIRLRASVIACLARELAALASRHPSQQETSPASSRRRCLATSGEGPGDSSA